MAGGVPVADSNLAWALRYEWQGIQLEDYPYVQDYIGRLTARSAIKSFIDPSVISSISNRFRPRQVVRFCLYLAFGAATLLALQSRKPLLIPY